MNSVSVKATRPAGLVPAQSAVEKHTQEKAKLPCGHTELSSAITFTGEAAGVHVQLSRSG